MAGTVPVRHTWSPIADLPVDWRTTLENPETRALVQVWAQQAGELREKDLYKSFLAKLRRSWAIETGVLEGVYTLSEGATIALIEKGLDASMITHGDTTDSPDRVFVKIQDHHRAIMGLHQFVSGGRPLGTSYIKELHQVLTAHQDTYVATDTLGYLVEPALPKGEWKSLPNSVEHADGTVFEYCPPEHVAQEMEHLVALHARHDRDGVPPDIEAAWIHHRFTLIHPFTDGNGRVARCLATLVLLKAEWLPLVITRKDREPYISALRSADNGDLRPLVDFFGALQCKAIREALSLSEELVAEAKAVESVLDSVKAKLDKRRAALSKLVERAFETASSLELLARDRLREVAAEVQSTIADVGYKAYVYFASKGDPKAKYHYYQIVQCARSLGYFANLSTYQAWAALAIVTEQKCEILFSFHGIGRDAPGVLGCAAMAYTKEQTESGENAVGEVTPLAEAPFGFTYIEDPVEVRQRFRAWLDQCIVRGLDYWQKTL